jgi:transposase
MNNNPTNNQAPKGRRQYTQEFKQQAVQLALSGEYTQQQTAERLGIKYTTLLGWLKQHRQPHKPGALSPDEREELKRLRKENERLKMERDILKKAAWLLGQPSE